MADSPAAGSPPKCRGKEPVSPLADAARIPGCFDLAQTLDCGQAFRWRKIKDCPETWEGVAYGRLLRLGSIADGLELFCSAGDLEEVWNRYFDLEEDSPAIRRALSALSPVLEEAVAYAPGIRILRQEPWEALCSFIFSQNNHIPRIKSIIERFCQMFGPPIQQGFHGFPSPETVAALSPGDLEALHAGYRVPYILDAARKVASGEIDLLRIERSPLEYGREELQKIKGVGPKVAECALLYGFHKTRCFPMDVWMKRAMGTLLPGVRPEDLGEYAGIAQQYIFHYSRMHPELF